MGTLWVQSPSPALLDNSGYQKKLLLPEHRGAVGLCAREVLSLHLQPEISFNFYSGKVKINIFI